MIGASASSVATFVAGAAAIGWCLPCAWVVAECALSLLPGRRRDAPAATPSPTPRPTVAILVPAHDEERGIARTIAAVAPQLGRADRLCVIAHNCTDRTAAVARSLGAEAREVATPGKVGKTWAVAAGIEWLREDPRDVVIIVDADCQPAEDALNRLARAAARSDGAVQASYLLRAPDTASPRTEISAFAVLVKNLARPLGLARIGLPTLCFGAGLTLPWRIARDLPLDPSALAEDYQLTLDLARRGEFVTYCAEARIDSLLPAANDGASRQRRRWEHGHFLLLLQVPGLIARAVQCGSPRLLALAFEIAVPPLISLLLAGGVVGLAAAAVWWAGGSPWPLATTATGVGALLLALLAVRARHGDGRPSWRTLASLPRYVLWKLPLYARFFRARETEWRRTPRDGE